MFCFIYKWMISQALDSGKAPGKTLNRHIAGCSNCREFVRVSGSLVSRLSRDAGGFLHKNPDAINSLNIAIMNAIDVKSPPQPELKRHFNFRPLPALTAVLLVLVIMISIGLQFIPITDSKPVEHSMTALNQPEPETEIVKNPLKIIEDVESPMESELNNLKHSINSATDFLISCLDVKIGSQ